MANAEDYVAQAAKYIGVSGTDNIFNTWIWGQHCYDPDIYPWCAAFQSYVGVHDLGMPFNPSASAAGVANQGERVPDEQAQRGDWVLFNWDGRQTFGWADHIGLVEWFDQESGYFGTIEGNCNDMVQRCTRYNYGSYATAFFRPPYKEEKVVKWPVQMYDLNGTDAQKWHPQKNADGTYTLISAANGMALDVMGGKNKSGTGIQAYEQNGAIAQKWKIIESTKTPSAGKYDPAFVAPIRLAPACAPKLRLTASSGKLKIITASYKRNAQNWGVVDCGDGYWILINAASKKALDLQGGGK